MGYKLLDVEFNSDWDEVIACEWDSYENPMQTFFRLFAPVFGEGPDARKAGIEECSSRQLGWHKSDPVSYWQKVVDDNGNIVGGATWYIYETDPVHENLEADWYPNDETREYVDAALEIFDHPRSQMATRPHVCEWINPKSSAVAEVLKQNEIVLFNVFTHPDHRRKGVADMILDWGERKADELGVEMWLDATKMGVPVYQRHGFVVVNENHVKPVKENPGEAWKKIDAELQPMVMWQMWRPAGGKFVEGETAKPWET